MSEIIAIEASREYLITDSSFDKCDKCKQLFAKLFSFTPVIKTHNFDDFNLCIKCLAECGMKYNIDINELRAAETVKKWLKTKK